MSKTTATTTRGHADSAKTPPYWRSWPSQGRYGSYALTVPQVALRLGIAEWSIREEIRQGRLQAVKHTRYVLGGGRMLRRQRWLILWRDIEAWWMARTEEEQERQGARRARRRAAAEIAVGSTGSAVALDSDPAGPRARPAPERAPRGERVKAPPHA